MRESQGQFIGQTMSNSTLTGQTMQDSLNYKGQQQLSQDFTVSGEDNSFYSRIYIQVCIPVGCAPHAC